MAETNPNADVNIKVGAEANIDGATKNILSEFDAMEERLRRIGTEEAKALAKQLQAVTRGLSEGAFKSEDVEELAQGFAAIAKDAQISDNAISDFSSILSNAVGRSRQLSDYMRKTKDGATGAERAVNAASKFLDSKMSPAAQKINGWVGNIAGKIPGVQSMLSKMPALASSIGVALKAALVVAEKLISLSAEYKASMREWQERRMAIKAENIQNDYTNTIAQLDLEDRKRKEALANEKALKEAELELKNLEEQRALSERLQNTPTSRERGMLELNERRQAEIRRQDRNAAALDEDMGDAVKEGESLTKRKDALKERMDKEREQLDEMLDKLGVAESERSSYDELMEMAESGAIDKPELMERAAAKIKDALMNNSIISNLIKASGKMEFTPEEAEAMRKKTQDEVRRQIQNIVSMRQQDKGLDQDIVQNNRRVDLIKKQQDIAEAARNAQNEKWRAEEKARQQELEESLAGKRAELMGSGNRLTALGLGGGNVGVDYGKDIANNTKEMLAILKENMKGYNRKGIAGDNKLNGPNIAAQSSLGDWGKMGWGM